MTACATCLLSAWRNLRREIRSDTAANLIEYSLVIALLGFGALAGMAQLGCEINCVYTQLSITMEKGRDNIPPGQMQKCVRTCP